MTTMYLQLVMDETLLLERIEVVFLLFLLGIEIEMCRIVQYMRGMHEISHISDGQV